ncbi:hypothetical protein ACTXPA_13420 [Glutamicibacter arilaitensis]|uniref:hypothetical protein n=1 Tax=Glutamicibacter arilaitensis TaxID=256701 RepID=UPI003F98593C
MSEQTGAGLAGSAEEEKQRLAAEEKKRHDEHDEELVEEWEDESFPASDPPSNY